MKKMKVRSKATKKSKIKVVGKKEYVDNETGEIEIVNEISMYAGDFNFHKIWLGHILQSLDAIGNQKLRVAMYVIDNLNADNQFIQSQRQVAKDIGVSYPTVNETFKLLEDSNFLKKQDKVYIINPNCIFKGRSNKRMSILLKYNEIDDNKKTSADTDEFKEKFSN